MNSTFWNVAEDFQFFFVHLAGGKGWERCSNDLGVWGCTWSAFSDWDFVHNFERVGMCDDRLAICCLSPSVWVPAGDNRCSPPDKWLLPFTKKGRLFKSQTWLLFSLRLILVFNFSLLCLIWEKMSHSHKSDCKGKKNWKKHYSVTFKDFFNFSGS